MVMWYGILVFIFLMNHFIFIKNSFLSAFIYYFMPSLAFNKSASEPFLFVINDAIRNSFINISRDAVANCS